MGLANLKVFSDWAHTTLTEVLTYNVDLFNQATRGAIVLEAKSNAGDYSSQTLWAKIAGLVRRRDAYGSGSVTAKDLAQLEEISVKVAAGTPPVNIDPGMFRWINKSPEEAGVVYGRQLAQDRLADMVDVTIAALAAGLGGVAALTHDATDGVSTLGDMNSGRAKLGDRYNMLAAWLLHSKVAFDIWGANLTNTNQLFQFGTVNILQDGFGNPLIISDSPSLRVADGINIDPGGTDELVDLYRTLGLVSGAALVQDNGDFDQNVETSNGDENIARTIQSEWSYNVGLKGFAWDKANGGKSPTTAALGTGSNWDKVATSVKDLPGVLVNSR